MNREQVSTGTVWEEKVGYSRAVRMGDTIHVSGTTAWDEEGNIIGVDDPYRQTVQCIDNIERGLESLNASLEDVIRTRLFAVNIDHFDEIGRAHGEAFGEIRPALTFVGIDRLNDPDMLLEMEAVAMVDV